VYQIQTLQQLYWRHHQLVPKQNRLVDSTELLSVTVRVYRSILLGCEMDWGRVSSRYELVMVRPNWYWVKSWQGTSWNGNELTGTPFGVQVYTKIVDGDICGKGPVPATPKHTTQMRRAVCQV